MAADFGAKGDRGQGVDGADEYLMVYQGTEGGDEVWGEVVEVMDAGDVSEEVFCLQILPVGTRCFVRCDGRWCKGAGDVE